MIRLAALLLLGCTAVAAQAPPGDPEAPFVAAQDLLLEGRPAEAHALVQSAQETYRQRGDRHREALCWIFLGTAEIRQADFPAAVASFTEATRTLEALGDRFGAWAGLHLLALMEAQERTSDAVAHQRQALLLLRELATSREALAADTVRVLIPLFPLPEAPDPVLVEIAELLSRDRLIEALLKTRRLREAEAELPRLSELSRRLGGTFDARATLHEGMLRQLQGRLEEARQLLRLALERTTPKPDAPLRTRDHEMEILGSLVTLEILNSRPEEALPWTDRAIALAKQRGKPFELATALQLRAEALEKCERREEAEAALREALALMHKTGSLARQAQIYERLGNFASRANRLAEAAMHLETAIGLFRAIRLPSAEARAWRSLALVYFQVESHASARMALQKARALAGESGAPLASTMVDVLEQITRFQTSQEAFKETAQVLAALLELPEVYHLRPQQIRDLQALITVFRPGFPDSSSSESGAFLTGLSHAVMALAQFRLGNLTAARDEALAALEGRPDAEVEISLRMLLEFSLEKEGKRREALQHLTRALRLVEETAEDLRVEELLASYLSGSSQQMLFGHVIELLLAEGRIMEAFDTTERARARAFLQSLGNHQPMSERGGEAHLAEETEALRRQIADGERQMLTAPSSERGRLAEDLQAARQRYESLSIRLKASNPDRASLVQVEPVPLAAVQKDLPGDVTLISYFVTGARVHAWVIDRDSVEHTVLPVRPWDLQRGLCWADRISQRGRSRSVRLREPECPRGRLGPKALYKKLFSPLVRKIRHEKLILVPHGALHHIPFAALRSPGTGRYLIEDYTLILAPGASALHVLRGKETPVAGTALVLGAPEELDPDLGPLPGARREARRVAALFGTPPLLGEQATEDRLHGLGGEIDLLHIAAHGLYDPQRPLFSRIALAPGEAHDGFLEVHEILNHLDLSGVNLVVLSACQTARGERSGGDEVTGLTRAFLGAGSPGVISTLWNIDDAAAVHLMRHFYDRLLDGAPAAEALRSAQLALLRSTRYRNPYYWAAFHLTGDPQGRWARR